MKKKLIAIAGLMMSLTGWSQLTIHGSIQRGSTPDKVDIVFIPTYTSNAGEFVNSLNISIAVPSASASGLTPTIAGVGNFTGMTLNQASPFGYMLGTETIYTWVYGSGPTSMSWTNGTPFVGITITFANGGAPAQVKLVDLTNQGGGTDGQSFFALTTNRPNDATDYGNFFIAQSDPNGSALGTYPNGPGPGDDDFYVETNLLISLPVNMLNFSGYKSGGKNTLNWTVTSEVNNKGFEVLRSTDGVSYSSIGFVNSLVGGNSTSEVHYTYDDISPTGKKQYYRLKQVDLDGKSKQSNIVMITRDKPTSLMIGGLFPNPARETVNVIVETPQRDRVTLVLTDMAGKIVKQQVENVDVGSNTVPVNIAKLSSGSYLVKLICQSSDCQTASAKFNKQ